ncbi:TetR/AcrR family transcriptional regulator [Bacillus sp. V5-8f]|uniref:TetR/AcrR family transcriptional regulator n=1 Tax=Bacillus sp. V5-8f TaxID=2053044 RepID=UPI000C76F496|nr:TetR/AcrR family transcriptional regulator [Bacillus sp. V5-8f]PLT33266.1 TetR/AcrR family transcriptional regulator [Bacillus sp. V5-8f]
MTIRERKNAKKREDILRSAAGILSRKGYQRTTMEDIAAELLMTKGALYYYFKNKEDLMYQCHSFILSNAVDTLGKIVAVEGTVVDKLRKAIITHIDFAINEKETFNMIIKPDQTFTDDRLMTILGQREVYAAIFDQLIQQGVDNGEFHKVDVKMVRMIILGATNWIQQWYSPKGQYNQKEVSKLFSDYLLRILI